MGLLLDFSKGTSLVSAYSHGSACGIEQLGGLEADRFEAESFWSAVRAVLGEIPESIKQIISIVLSEKLDLTPRAILNELRQHLRQ